MTDKDTDVTGTAPQRPLPSRKRKPYEEYTPADVAARLDEARKDLTDPKSPLAKLLSDPEDLENHLRKVERLIVGSIEKAFIKVGKEFDRKGFVEKVSTLRQKTKPTVDDVPAAAPVEKKITQENEERSDIAVDKPVTAPTKTSTPKEIEKVVVVDKKGDLSGIKVADLALAQDPAGKEEPDDTKSRSLLGRIGKDMFSTAFPTLSKLTKTVSGPEGESGKDKLTRLGKDIFRTAFPTIAKVIEYVQDERKQKSTVGVREASRNRRMLEKTESMATALLNLTTEQKRSVDLLEDVLAAIKGLANQGRGRFGRLLGAAGRVLGAAGTAIRATGAASAAVAGAVGFSSYNQLNRERQENAAVSDSAMVPQMEQAVEQRQEQPLIAGEDISHSAENGSFVVDGVQVDENTYNEFIGIISQNIQPDDISAQIRRDQAVTNLLVEIRSGRRAPQASVAVDETTAPNRLEMPVQQPTDDSRSVQTPDIQYQESTRNEGNTRDPAEQALPNSGQRDAIAQRIEQRQQTLLQQYSNNVSDRLIQIAEQNSRENSDEAVSRRVYIAMNLLREDKLDEASLVAEQAAQLLQSSDLSTNRDMAQRISDTSVGSSPISSNVSIPIIRISTPKRVGYDATSKQSEPYKSVEPVGPLVRDQVTPATTLDAAVAPGSAVKEPFIPAKILGASDLPRPSINEQVTSNTVEPMGSSIKEQVTSNTVEPMGSSIKEQVTPNANLDSYDLPSPLIKKSVTPNTVEQMKSLTKEQVTHSLNLDASGLSGTDLILKARSVTFRGDEIEFSRQGRAVSAPGGAPLSTGATRNRITPMSVPNGGTTAVSEGTGSQQLSTEQQDQAYTGDLTFASGVDPRIKKEIAQKVQQIESAFGKKLTVTSGFRDQHRNAAAGGARNSAHTRANAVDIQFQGNEEETNRLIEIASVAGIGGIGVYRPGWVHLDVESKRVWGPDFSARSVPEWSKDTLRAHMAGEISKTETRDTAPAELVASSPASPSVAPAVSDGGEGGGQIEQSAGQSAPIPETSGGEIGTIVAAASQENAVAERTPVPPTVTTVEPQVPGTATPGTSVPRDTMQSVSDPGNVEPDDAAERYAKLFNMAA